MAARPALDALLASAIDHLNRGRSAEARAACERAAQAAPDHPAVQQLLAVLCMQEGDPGAALAHAKASLARRPDHAPTHSVAADAALAALQPEEARRHRLEARALGAPDDADAWFELALVRHDQHDLEGAAAALRRVLQLQPGRAEAEVNLAIALQDAGHVSEAMRAFGRAYRLRDESFGRIAHALAASGHGRLWLDLDALREQLRTAPP